MGLDRKNSVKVANVLVPQRLLSTRTRNKDWSPQAVQSQESQDNDHLEEELQRARHARDRRVRPSSAIYGFNVAGASEPAHATRPRKTSDPTTIREEFSARSSAFTSREDLSKFKPAHKYTESSTTSVGESFSKFHWDNNENNNNNNNNNHHSNQQHWDSSRPETAHSGYSTDVRDEPPIAPQRSGTVKNIVKAVIPDAVIDRTRDLAQRARRGSIVDVYERAKVRGAQLERKKWVQVLFEYTIYLLLLCFVYFVLIGMPLWKGAVYWLYWVVSTKFVITGGWSITIGIAAM